MTAQVLMIASGKGGTGKSTLSVFLGAELAALGKKVLLIELDSGLRSVDIIAGISGQTVYDIADILSGRCEPEKAVVESPVSPGLFIVSAPYTGGHVVEEDLQKLCRHMAPHFDYLLIDTAAGLGTPFRAALAAANLCIVLVTPDKICLRDGRIVADEVFKKDKACRLLINRVRPRRVTRYGIENLDECIDTVGVQLLGVLSEEDDIQYAAAEGRPLPEGSAAKRMVQNIAKRITGQYVPLFHR